LVAKKKRGFSRVTPRILVVIGVIVVVVVVVVVREEFLRCVRVRWLLLNDADDADDAADADDNAVSAPRCRIRKDLNGGWRYASLEDTLTAHSTSVHIHRQEDDDEPLHRLVRRS
jgi:hypothetical protein